MAVTQADQRVIKIGAQGDAIANTWLDVESFVWVGATTIAHALLVVDSNGNTVFQDVASVANYFSFYPLNNKIYGLSVTTMGSGTLYLNRRDPYRGKN